MPQSSAYPARDETMSRVSHICLAGRTICNDWLLIRALKTQHQVTLVEHIQALSRNPILARVDVLVLDCGENQKMGLGLVPNLKRDNPKMCVVLVDGGFTRQQIAKAFREGVKDYFAEPYDRRLLVERVEGLG